MQLEAFQAYLAGAIKRLRTLLSTLSLHQEHPFIALTIADTKSTGRELQRLLSSIQAKQRDSTKPIAYNEVELSDLGNLSKKVIAPESVIQSERAIIASLIKEVLLRRQMTDVMSAGYGYFLCPHNIVNEIYRDMARPIADEYEDRDYAAERAEFIITSTPPKADDTTVFRMLLPDYTIIGRQDLLQGIIKEPPIYGMVVYSEQLYTTKTGSVISIPHLFHHDFATILAAFYLDVGQIERLKANVNSGFYKTTITPLTPLEKAAVCNFKWMSSDKMLIDAPKKFFLWLKAWMRAENRLDLNFLAMLSMMQDAIRMQDDTYIQVAFKDFLWYWSNLTNKQQDLFTDWYFSHSKELLSFNDIVSLIREYLTKNNFKAVYWLIGITEDIFRCVRTKQGNYTVCYMQLKQRKNYITLLTHQLQIDHQLCQRILGDSDSAELVKMRPDNPWSSQEKQKIKEVLAIIIKAERTAGKKTFPLVMTSARSIGLAFSQLNPVHYEAYLHTIFGYTGGLFTHAVDFKRAMKFVRTRHLATVFNLLLPFLENYLCLNKKTDERTSNQTFLNFKDLVRELSMPQLVVVLNAIRDKLPRIMSSLNRFNLLLQFVETEQDKCEFIYNTMKDKLKPVNGVEFQLVMQYLRFSTSISREFYQQCKKDDIVNILVMINTVVDKTVLDNYRGFIEYLPHEDLRGEIISALYQVITCRYIPIYKALRKAQWGFWRTNLVDDLEKLGSEAEKVELVLKHVSIGTSTRSAVAWGLACRWSDRDVNLLQEVLAKAESNLGGFALLIRNGLFSLGASPVSPVQLTEQPEQLITNAVQTELAAVRSVSFMLNRTL